MKRESMCVCIWNEKMKTKQAVNLAPDFLSGITAFPMTYSFGNPGK